MATLTSWKYVKGKKRRKITVTSSLHEISVDQLGHGRRNFKDTKSLNVVFTGHFVWGGEAILKVLNLVRNRV